MLDTLRRIETPEGVELTLAVAGPVPRALAWLIDGLIRLALYSVLSFALTFAGDIGWGVWLIALFLIEWFYPVVFEIYRDGATPGKAALGLRVLQDDGTPVNPSASMVRNLLRSIDFLPFMYGAGLITMLLNADFKRLGDLVAGTVVVHRDRPPRAAPPPQAPPHPPHLPLELQEQQAMISFMERSTQLSGERNEELAQLASIAAGQRTGGSQHTLHKVLGVASWIAGER